MVGNPDINTYQARHNVSSESVSSSDHVRVLHLWIGKPHLFNTFHNHSNVHLNKH